MSNTPDSKHEAPVFDHHPTCSRRGGTSCSCRASVAAVQGDADSILQRLVETPAGERIRMKCGAADLRSVITDTLAAVSSPAPAELPPNIFNEDRCMFCGGKTAHEPDCSHGRLTRFKVGDKLRNVHASYLPIATVTEFTARGFKYELERPLVISPRLGTQVGGESYNDSQWELAPAEPLQPTGEQEKK